MSQAHRRRWREDQPERAWRPEEIALLGTMLDREVAKQIGRDYKTVAAYHKSKGIPSFRERHSCRACKGR